MAVDTTPLTPGVDPIPASYSTEQWEVEANQYGKPIDTHMPSSYVALASLFLRNTQQLGLNSGATMNTLARNALYRAYGEGEAMVDVAALAAALSIHVSTLSGFTQKLQNGRLSAVGGANPLPITFSTAEPANTVVGFVPDDAPFGPGLLLLGAALVGAVATRVGVFASTRAMRVRVGGGATVDALTGANIVTLDDIISAVARLRANNVPPHADGKYHVHMNSAVEAQIYRDNHWQRLHQSLPNSADYRDLSIGDLVGCYFYRNEENPNSQNAGPTIADAGGAGGALMAKRLGLEITNAAGLAINRTLVTGGGSLVEKYLDESQFITEAGVNGKIGEFSIVNGGVQIMTRRIRYILRAPQDRLQQVISLAWSWSGDFGVPSDQLTGDNARFKRCVEVESA